MDQTLSFAMLDNSLLESSMGSTQGLLSFMTDASKQIKTYLGESEKKTQKKQLEQRLLQQLSQINCRSEYIPNILQSSNFSITPASPTPSLDSVGSMDDDIDRSSCLISNQRKRKYSTNYSSSKKSRHFDFNNKSYRNDNDTTTESIPRYMTTCRSNDIENNTDLSFDTLDTFVPSPSPDFDDLVNCMLTDDFITPIDLNSYLANV